MNIELANSSILGLSQFILSEHLGFAQSSHQTVSSILKAWSELIPTLIRSSPRKVAEHPADVDIK